MRLRGTHVGLCGSGHRLRAEDHVRNLLIHKVDKSRVDLLRVGHREGLDVYFIVQSGNDDLVLCGVDDFAGKALAVSIALRDGLAVDNRLAVGTRKIHVVGHREFLGQNQGRGGRKETQIARIDENVVAAVGFLREIPAGRPHALTLHHAALVRQHVAPLDDVHLPKASRAGVRAGHDLQQRVTIELRLDDAADDLVELRALYLARLLHILDVLAFFVLAGQHVTVSENLAHKRLQHGPDMGILLQARLVEVDQRTAVVQYRSPDYRRAHRTIAVRAVDLADILLNDLLAGAENRLQKLMVERAVEIFFSHFSRFPKSRRTMPKVVKTRWLC